MSQFLCVEKAPPIEVFEVNRACQEDPHPNKVNLSIGAYRTNEGKPWVLPVVKSTEISINKNETINHEYLPICGTEIFTLAATNLLLGENNLAITEKRAFGVQSLSGTGALRIGAEFLRQELATRVFYVSEPTWGNHLKIFMDSGFESSRKYRYWDETNRSIDMDGFLADLNEAPEGAVIVLHACAHNPTGCDPTQKQWKQIADLMEKRKLFPFFDCAYQGFATGDPDRDAYAVRYFVDRGFELFAAQSFAKNFGLYCERVGNLTVVINSPDMKAAVLSQFALIIRGMYSNPPAYGSRIVATILTHDNLRAEWRECIETMSSRILKMRKALYDKLVELKTPGTWEHIITQIGMFSYTGLTASQAKTLRDEYHIYLLKSGRINMCGLNESNVNYFAESMHTVITNSL